MQATHFNDWFIAAFYSDHRPVSFQCVPFGYSMWWPVAAQRSASADASFKLIVLKNQKTHN
jgi:hypothetical protein